MVDARAAVWLSYSALNAFDRCPKAYYYQYVYRDPQTRRRITIVSPALTLGTVIHEVIEAISQLPTKERLVVPLSDRFYQIWTKMAGIKGGFANEAEEATFKLRGEQMIDRLMVKPGPLVELAVKIKAELPYYWLSEKDNLILCGKIDWLKYHPDKDGVTIIDFKTGKNEEATNSLQLPIYALIVKSCQKRPILGAGYWYLGQDGKLIRVELPDLEEIQRQIIEKGKQIALARKLNRFACPQNGSCPACRPYEQILAKKATYVGLNERNQEVYTLNQDRELVEEMSEVL